MGAALFDRLRAGFEAVPFQGSDWEPQVLRLPFAALGVDQDDSRRSPSTFRPSDEDLSLGTPDSAQGRLSIRPPRRPSLLVSEGASTGRLKAEGNAAIESGKVGQQCGAARSHQPIRGVQLPGIA
jgi:hypothetical protein